MMFSHARRSAGFSLIEAAIVLAIIGLVIGGIWAATNSVNQNRKAERMVTNVMVMIDGILNLYKDQTVVGPYTDMTADMIAAGVVPKELVNGTTLTSPYGTSITVTRDDNTITIEFGTQLTGVACRKSMLGIFSALQNMPTFKSGYIDMKINGDDVVSDGTETPSTVMNRCAAEGNPDDNSQIIFYF